MLDVYTIEKKEHWDSIVRSFHNYDVYWLSGYVKAFQIHGDGQPLLFRYEGEKIRSLIRFQKASTLTLQLLTVMVVGL